MAKVYEVSCAGCGVAFEAGSSRAKWCSAGCKKRAQRKPRPVEPESVEPESVVAANGEGVESAGLVAAIRAELELAGALGSYPGQLAMQLARRIVAPGESGISALSKELRTVMGAALAGVVPPAADESVEEDEVEAARRRRAEKAAAAAGRS